MDKLRQQTRRLEEAKGRWIEELPQVLWSYHTTPHSYTNETHFRLTFSIEAVKEYAAKVRAARQQRQRLAHRHFQPHDLVLRKITRTTDDNKLTPIWKGPYRITEEASKGAYCLEHLDSKKIPRTWNTMNLHAYHS
ncbi:hypothetical protein CR513_18101, partial [Mucuna pruriens]